MLENPSEPLMQQIMSPGALDILEEGLTSPSTTAALRERLMEVLAAVTYISGNGERMLAPAIDRLCLHCLLSKKRSSSRGERIT